MDHEERGIALVININKYEPNPMKLKEREWSKEDVITLNKTLKYLEFKVELVKNSTKEQIKARLQQIVTEIDHKDFDCFLCVVMSHGINDSFATGNSELMSFEEIKAPIKTCPSLKNKPKMFFFQACRGEKEMESTQNSRVSSACSTKSSKGAQMADDLTSASIQSNNNSKTKFNEETDLFVFNSTLPDHYSYSNNVAEGTIFIQSFCDVFNDAYKNLPNNLSLAQMIIRINEKVSESQQQISDPIFRMSKEIYFRPKNVSNLILLKLFFRFFSRKVFFELISLNKIQ
jgi:caspase 7